jgi:hypothetical protein
LSRFKPFQLLFLIPGIGLIITSLFVPLNYLHRQIFWTETEALMEFTEFDNGMKGGARCRLQFTDIHGKVYDFYPNTDDTFTEGKDYKHIRIYYDPANPADALLVNHGQYLLILFFPFALLLTYLGLPENRSKKENSYRIS